MKNQFSDEEKAQIAGRRCFCGWWPCDTHTDEDRIAHAARESFNEDHRTGNDKTERSIKHSYRGEAKNYVD